MSDVPSSEPLPNATSSQPDLDSPSVSPAAQPSPDAVAHVRNEDPLIPEVFRETIPPAPRGWTEEEWRTSFLGTGQSSKTQGLSLGKGWLLPVILGVVVVGLVIVVIIFATTAH